MSEHHANLDRMRRAALELQQAALDASDSAKDPNVTDDERTRATVDAVTSCLRTLAKLKGTQHALVLAALLVVTPELDRR